MTHKLTRTGDSPLVFDGEIISESDGQWHNGQEQNRYHSLAIYTCGNRYVVAIEYCTNWQGEGSLALAEVCDDAGQVREFLRDYDPTAPVVGFPPTKAYTERQKHLMDGIVQRYDAQVSEVLDGDQFTEVVE